jgi:flagellar basal body rod protein FlgG
MCGKIEVFGSFLPLPVATIARWGGVGFCNPLQIKVFLTMAWSLLQGSVVNVSLFQAASALDANDRWQEVIADNLASSSVPGYRQQQLSLAATQAGLMPANGGRNLPQYFTIPKGTVTTNFTPGELKYTGNNSDLAIEGKGFFQVQLPNGSVGLTRDGEFQVNSKAQLVTKEGYPVLGSGGPIQLMRGNSAPLSFSANGEISQGDAPRGKLKLAEVEDPHKLTQISGGYFVAEHGAVTTQASTSTLREGYLEGSNTSSLVEMASMMTAMRGFEANQHVIQIQDDRLSKTISELGNPS